MREKWFSITLVKLLWHAYALENKFKIRHDVNVPCGATRSTAWPLSRVQCLRECSTLYASMLQHNYSSSNEISCTEALMILISNGRMGNGLGHGKLFSIRTAELHNQNQAPIKQKWKKRRGRSDEERKKLHFIANERWMRDIIQWIWLSSIECMHFVVQRRGGRGGQKKVN